jgi:hypothetical protein
MKSNSNEIETSVRVRTFEASIQKAGSGEAQAQRVQETLNTQMMNTI